MMIQQIGLLVLTILCITLCIFALRESLKLLADPKGTMSRTVLASFAAFFMLTIILFVAISLFIIATTIHPNLWGIEWWTVTTNP
jgi:hypothetical protein